MQALQNWFSAKKLTLNVQKSVCMLFVPNGRCVKIDLELDGLKIPQVRNTKLLGTWIDDELKWNEHVNKIILKLKSKIHMLYKGKNLLSCHAKQVLYFAQIQSHLTYGLVCWGNMLNESQLSRLKKIQNKCVRLIDTSKSLEENYTTKNILKLEQLIVLENLKIWHKYHDKTLPEKLMESMKVDHHKNSLEKQHRYMTRGKHELNLPKAQHCKYRNSFLIKGLRNYQSMPPDIKAIKKIPSFIGKCKSKLLNRTS